MTYKHAYSLGFLAISLALMSCSTGSNGPAKIAYCQNGYAPISMDAAANNRKIEVKPGDALDIKPGEYSFVSSEYLFKDHDRDFVFHIDYKSNGQDDFLSPLCIAGKGLTQDTDGIQGSIEIITSMKVSADNKITLSTKRIGFHLGKGAPEGQFLTVSPGKTDVESTLSEVYEQYPIVEQALYEFTDGTYQSRVKLNETPEDKGKKAGVEQAARVTYSFSPAQ